MKRVPNSLATFFAFVLLVAASPRPAQAEGLWRGWDTGLKEANASGKPILVDVYTDWCGWCRRMDRDVYSRADVKEYLGKRFVAIKLDAEDDGGARYEGKSFTQRTLAARFRVTGYPTTVFLNSEGEHLANVPGYIPADRFLLLLHYIGDGHLAKGVAFEDFVKSSNASR